MVAFNQSVKYIDIIEVSGTTTAAADALNHVLAAVAVTDNGDGTVKLTTSAAHGLLVGSVVYIENTDSYNGLRMVTAVSGAELHIRAPFVAETTSGDDDVTVTVAAKRDYVFFGFRLKLSAAPTTPEDFTITADSALGSKFDLLLYSFDLVGTTDLIYAVDDNENLPRKKDDLIRFAWANSDDVDFGLEIFYGPLN